MIKSKKIMECGGCGGLLHSIFMAEKDNGDVVLIVNCNQCHSNSIIEFPRPTQSFIVKWPSNVDPQLKDGDGILTS